MYEGLNGIEPEDDALEGLSNGDIGYSESSRGLVKSSPTIGRVQDVHRIFSPSPSTMEPEELPFYLNRFHLIQTPFGYVLGQQNVANSPTLITRRYTTGSKSSKKGFLPNDSPSIRIVKKDPSTFRLSLGSMKPEELRLHISRTCLITAIYGYLMGKQEHTEAPTKISKTSGMGY